VTTLSPTESFWEDFYRDREQVWSGRANPLLVAGVADLRPGTALDLGCGEGADAIWLAARGWRVTAVDVSATALERAARHAAEAGVQVDWQRHDLEFSFPEGSYDLVSAQFFHSPVDLDRRRVLRLAADAVRVGGTLLVGGHLGWPSWVTEEHRHDVHFPTPDEVVADAGLHEPDWRVAPARLEQREITSPEGEVGVREDCLVAAVRLAGPAPR
jgi:SAM-dependent methyltransferase